MNDDHCGQIPDFLRYTNMLLIKYLPAVLHLDFNVTKRTFIMSYLFYLLVAIG